MTQKHTNYLQMQDATRQFFELLYGKATYIRFLAWKRFHKITKGKFKTTTKSLYHVYSTYKKPRNRRFLENLFFTVNLFQNIQYTKKQHCKNGKQIDLKFFMEARNKGNITEKTAFYLDFDLKDSQGQPLNDNDLQQEKAKLYQQFSNFPVFPSAIVESRNGFHTYWVINLHERKISNSEWQDLENAIYDFAYQHISDTADKKATDITRVLRLPESIHKKDNQTPFMVQVKHVSDKRYSINELKQVFCVTNTATVQQPQQKVKQVKNDTNSINAVVQLVKNKDINLEHIQIQPTTKTFNTAITYIKQFPIHDFFQISNPNSCLSLIRQESNPSGSIYYSQQSNAYLFHDFGTSETLDLINLVAHIQNVTNVESINYLCKVFDITVQQNEFNFAKFKRDSIHTFDRLSTDYKPLKSAKQVFIAILDTLNERANEKGFTNPLAFHCMLASRYIAEQLKTSDFSKISRVIHVFEYLGLIQRVNGIPINPNQTDIEWKDIANNPATFYKIANINNMDYSLLKHKCFLLQNEINNVWRNATKSKLQQIIMENAL